MFNSTTVTNLATGRSHLRLQGSQLNLPSCQQHQPTSAATASNTTSHYASNNPLPFVRSVNDRHGHQQMLQTSHDNNITTATTASTTQLQQVSQPHQTASTMSQFSLPITSHVHHSLGHSLDHLQISNESGSTSDGLGVVGRFVMDQQQLYPHLTGDSSDLTPAAFFQQYYHTNTTASQHHAANLNSANHLYYSTSNVNTSNTNHHHYQQSHHHHHHHHQQQQQQQHDTQISFANAMAGIGGTCVDDANVDPGSVPIRLNNTGNSTNGSQLIEANQAANLMGATLNSFRYRHHQPYLDARLGLTENTDNNSMHASTQSLLDPTMNSNLAVFNKLVANNDNSNHYHGSSSSDGINLSTDICTESGNNDNNHQHHNQTISTSSSNGNGKGSNNGGVGVVVNNGGSNINNLSKRGSRKNSEKSASSESLKRSFACPTCSKGFSEKFNMRRHMQIHSQSRPKYSCNECSKSFAWKDNFIRHRKAAHINNSC